MGVLIGFMGERTLIRTAPPPPGSDEALAEGCTCPILDNAHGRGIMGLGKDFVVAQGCPLHDMRQFREKNK